MLLTLVSGSAAVQQHSRWHIGGATANWFRRTVSCNATETSVGGRDELKAKEQVDLPGRGFFAQADTKAEVYPALGGVDRGNIYKRGGRHAPEFLWNVNWKEQLDFEEAVERSRAEELAREKLPPSGALSFSRVQDLNSLEVDLSEQLQARPKPQPAAASPAAAPPASALKPSKGRSTAARLSMRATAAASAERGPSKGSYARMPPRANEEKRWKRNDRFNATMAKSSEEEKAASAAASAAERVAYQQLKQELQIATVGLGALCFAAAYAFHSKVPAIDVRSLSAMQEVAASYGLGAVGGYVYLRMLHRSIDAVAGEGGGSSSASRLLVPVVLVLAANRWNELKAEDVGLALQFVPLVLGFFTYKAAMVARGGLNLFSEIFTDPSASTPVSALPSESGPQE